MAVLLGATPSEAADDAAAAALAATAAARSRPAASAAAIAAAGGDPSCAMHVTTNDDNDASGASTTSATSQLVPKKRRGRPRKVATPIATPAESAESSVKRTVSSHCDITASSGKSLARAGDDGKRKREVKAAATASAEVPHSREAALFRELNAIPKGGLELPAKRMRSERFSHIHDEVALSDDEQYPPREEGEFNDGAFNDGDPQDDVESCLQFNPTDMYLTLAKYSGVFQQKRRSSMYLISNFINEFERTDVRPGGAGSPLYATFSGQWRGCDTVNQSLKYERMLYHHNVRRRCRDDQIRFDFVMTSAL